MKRRLLAVLAAIGLLAGLAGCAGKVELVGLALENSPITLTPGQTATVEPVPSLSTDAPSEEQISEALAQVTLVWSSSDEAVATVADGAVTGVAPGSAVITVGDSEGRYSADIDVTVVVPVEKASAPDEITLDILSGKTGKVDVDIQPAEATNVEITYASSDEAIATVTGDGTLTPVAEGEAEITITVASDNTEGRTEQVLTSKVIVKALPQAIGLEATEGVLYVGHSFQLEPYSLPEEAPESNYTFASSDKAVATVDEAGNMKAVSVGTATITITSAEGHTLDYALTVTTAPRGNGGSGGSGSSGGSGGSGGAGGTGVTGGDSGSVGGTGGGDTGTGGGDNGGTAPPSSGSGDSGGGATTPAPGDGTPGNPLPPIYKDVDDDELQDTDGLGGGAW